MLKGEGVVPGHPVNTDAIACVRALRCSMFVRVYETKQYTWVGLWRLVCRIRQAPYATLVYMSERGRGGLTVVENSAVAWREMGWRKEGSGSVIAVIELLIKPVN